MLLHGACHRTRPNHHSCTRAYTWPTSRRRQPRAKRPHGGINRRHDQVPPSTFITIQPTDACQGSTPHQTSASPHADGTRPFDPIARVVRALQHTAQRDGTRRGNERTQLFHNPTNQCIHASAPRLPQRVPNPHADGTRRWALQHTERRDGTRRRIECVAKCTTMPTFSHNFPSRIFRPVGGGRLVAGGRRPEGPPVAGDARRMHCPRASPNTHGCCGLVWGMAHGAGTGGFTTSPL